MLKRLARALVPGPLRYGDVRLKVELADGLADGWYDHDWEPLPELALLSGGRLRPDARAFDLGAHQGVVGMMLGHKVGVEGQVVLVEANPHNVALCGRNVSLNAMPWVVAHHAAVADHDGVLVFNGGLNGAAAEVSDYTGRVEVPAVTVDALATRYGPPDVVFVDVEGFECRTLSGGARTLDSAADWFVEVHVGCGLEAAGGSVAEVLAHFRPERYERWVHSEGDVAPIPLDTAPETKLLARFFLTAICRPGETG